MKNEEFNPAIKAVQRLRRIASEIRTDNSKILRHDADIIKGLEDAGKMVALNSDLRNEWVSLKGSLMDSISQLREIMVKLETKFKNKDITELSEIWTSHAAPKEMVVNHLSEMKGLGDAVFADEKLNEWENIWSRIRVSVDYIADISETYQLKLKLMESLKPEEIDELTKDILRHIPMKYTEEEAHRYEKEYIQAFNELKEIQSKKKNLWDKVLDILAGGIQETPAHRVQMRRWMEAEN